MTNGPADAEEIFPGSEGAANLVAWIDGILTALREGRVDLAREAMEEDGWRTLDLSGLPEPIIAEARQALDLAADALRPPAPSGDAAEQALLAARSRFMPGG